MFDCKNDTNFCPNFHKSICLFERNEKWAFLNADIKRCLCNSTVHYERDFGSYLAEYVWRKVHGHSMIDEIFKALLKVIINLYIPKIE